MPVVGHLRVVFRRDDLQRFIGELYAVLQAPRLLRTAPLDGDGPVGIQKDDLIEEFDGVAIAGVLEFQRQLRQTRPGAQVTLSVQRGGSEQPRSLKYRVTLTDEPLQVIAPEYDLQMPYDPHPRSLLLSIAGVGKRTWKSNEAAPPGLQLLREGNWRLQSSDDPATAEFRMLLTAEQLRETGLEGDWEFVKRYRLAKVAEGQQDNPDYPAYHLDLELEIHNRGETPQDLAFRLTGPNGLPIEGWWYSNKIHPALFKSAGARDVIWKPEGGSQQLKGTSQIHAFAMEHPDAPGMPLIDVQDPAPLDYIGVDTQYFASVFLPPRQEATPDEPSWLRFRKAEAVVLGDFQQIDGKAVRTTNTSVELTSFLEKVAPGTPLKQTYVLFAGPKRSDLLAAYGLDNVIEFGWFGFVARPLSRLLHTFYWMVGNYGIAIIMLTVLVRGCMFPISRKAARNAQKMQELAPELKKIAEKYKNDMEKRGQAQKELFAKHNYNPAGGCLLMFLQLPVFIGLYRTLSVDIELRQAPLIPGIEWASNLAGPDKLLRWDSMLPDWIAGESGWLGPYLNILPIVTVALFMVQQKLFTPPPTDEQTRMQHQVMKFMMIFMGVLFFRVPAGLCLYFISSSIWGICERLLLPKTQPNLTDSKAAKPSPAESRGKAPARSGTRGALKSDTNGSSRRERARRKQQRRR